MSEHYPEEAFDPAVMGEFHQAAAGTLGSWAPGEVAVKPSRSEAYQEARRLLDRGPEHRASFAQVLELASWLVEDGAAPEPPALAGPPDPLAGILAELNGTEAKTEPAKRTEAGVVRFAFERADGSLAWLANGELVPGDRILHREL